ERYAAMQMAEQYNRLLPAPIRKGVINPVLRAIPEAASTRSRFGKAHRFLAALDLPRGQRYLRWTSAIHEDLKAELCTSEFLSETVPGQTIAVLQDSFSGNGEIHIVDRAMMADTLHYLPNDLLVKVDIASMAASLEARSPFLDHHVMEFAAGLPAGYKLRKLTTKS